MKDGEMNADAVEKKQNELSQADRQKYQRGNRRALPRI